MNYLQTTCTTNYLYYQERAVEYATLIKSHCLNTVDQTAQKIYQLIQTNPHEIVTLTAILAATGVGPKTTAVAAVAFFIINTRGKNAPLPEPPAIPYQGPNNPSDAQAIPYQPTYNPPYTITQGLPVPLEIPTNSYNYSYPDFQSPPNPNQYQIVSSNPQFP